MSITARALLNQLQSLDAEQLDKPLLTYSWDADQFTGINDARIIEQGEADLYQFAIPGAFCLFLNKRPRV
jgi:hypothetical protein